MSDAGTHVVDRLDDYVHRLLHQDEAAAVEAHCAGCPACMAALAEAFARRQALGRMPETPGVPALIAATLQKIDQYEQQRRRRRRRLFRIAVGLVAATVLILGGLHLYFLNLKATPYDLVVLGQAQLIPNAMTALRIRVLDREKQVGLAGVPVTVELRRDGEVVQLARLTTDDLGSGQPRFRLPDWADGSYHLHVRADTPKGPEEINREIALRRSWKVLLSSDKPVYQPGQVIHLRSLALRRPELRPIADQATTFTVTDPKGNVLFKKKAPASRFGIAAADCLLDREITEGAYTLTCIVGDTESSLRVAVQKYVLPKFKIDAHLDRPYYQPGETMCCTVQARYFFGKAVAGKVMVEVNEESGQELAKLTASLDAEGKAQITYAIRENLVQAHNGSDVRLSLRITVTDSAGHKETQQEWRVVTQKPLRIQMADRDYLVLGVPNPISLWASWVDGRPARVRLAIPDQLRPTLTDERGMVHFELTPDSPQPSLKVQATDEKGSLLAEVVIPTRCSKSGMSFLLLPNRQQYRAGSTMRLVARGSGTQPVFVDLLVEGRSILTQTIPMAEGRGQTEIDLPTDLRGAVQMYGYRFDARDKTVHRSIWVSVLPPGDVRIKATLDRAEYRPGASARLNLNLTDAQGAACPGAVSLTGVDEAVYAVLTQAGNSPSLRPLEQQVLEAEYDPLSLSMQANVQKPGDEEIEMTDLDSQGEPGVSSAHSLVADTRASKLRQVKAVQNQGMTVVQVAWIFFAVLLFVGIFIAIWFGSPLLGAISTISFVLILAVMIFEGVYSGDAEPKHAAKSVPKTRQDSATTEKLAAGEGHEDNTNILPDRGLETRKTPNGQMSPYQSANGIPSARIRSYFPETLLWRPQLVSDDQGRVSLDIPLADSITTWRLAAGAVAADGRLGYTQLPLKVFQPFFVDLDLPVSLTRGDEVSVPVVVHNYLDKPQTVTLTLESPKGLPVQGDAERRLTLGPGEVRSLPYRVKAEKVGTFALRVRARGAGEDVVHRKIEVVPDGRAVEYVFNGSLDEPVKLPLNLPPSAIEGSARLLVKIYPSRFSQLVEGLENIFQMPHGCFEQTSSTTYPNILALDYLRRTGKSAPAVEAKAREYIHLGYQRLLSFEVAGGGFDWFGHAPANRILTAYGLMEFEDMARVHEVDPNLIARTRQWLLDQRQPNGSWLPESHPLGDDPTRGANAEQATLAATAYVASAVFAHGAASPQAAATRSYLLQHRPEAIKDAHVLALVCNALLALNPKDSGVQPYLQRLEALKQVSADGKLVWWQQAADASTPFHGSGRSGSVETTALATLALIEGGGTATTRRALTWLVAQKDSRGTWHSTQATVLALKALLAGTNRTLGDKTERRIDVRLGDHHDQLRIPADQDEVMKQLDLSASLVAGDQALSLREISTTQAGYQVTFRYHVAPKPADEPLTVALEYERTTLAVGERVQVKAKVSSRTKQAAPMALVELPVPAGFTAETENLAVLVEKGAIARFQTEPGRLLVYLRELAPGPALELPYRLRATLAGKVQAPGARVYEYYNPDRQGHSPATVLTVK